MKALSLWQPYASLIAIGAKQYETRSWQTPYRGILLAIHASKRWTREETHAVDMFRRHFPNETAKMHLPLPLSAVICVVRLVDILPTDAVRSQITLAERCFGNYEPNRFAWKLEVVEVFDPPIPAKGMQGLWNWNKPK